MSNSSHQAAWTTWVLFYVLILSSLLPRSIAAWTTIHVPNSRPWSSSPSQTTRRICHGTQSTTRRQQFVVTRQLLALNKKRQDTTATNETFKQFDSMRRNILILPSNLLRLGTTMAVAGQVVAPCVANDDDGRQPQQQPQQQQPQPQIDTVNSSTPPLPSSAVTTDPFAVFGEQLLQDFNTRDALQPQLQQKQQHWPYNAVSPLPPNSDGAQQQQHQETSLTDMERALQKAKDQKQIDPRTHG